MRTIPPIVANHHHHEGNPHYPRPPVRPLAVSGASRQNKFLLAARWGIWQLPDHEFRLFGKYMNRLLQAIDFAAIKHSRQRRKNAETSPYINHPVEVAFHLSSVGGVTDEDILIAALLHDTIEDTETTLEEIASIFGETVAAFVVECTDDKSLPKAERKRLQIEHAPKKSPGAKVIKIADKTCNLRSILSDPPKIGPCHASMITFCGQRKLYPD